jgi:hypothetical protein
MRMIAYLLCLICVGLAVMYFLVPAGQLPSQFPAFVYFLLPPNWIPSAFPGYEPGSAHIHTKHAVVALAGAVVLFSIGWFVGRR